MRQVSLANNVHVAASPHSCVLPAAVVKVRSKIHDVRACVSAEVAHSMKSHVAFFCFSVNAALIGKPQFQIDVTRFPFGPFGHRA